MNNVEGINGGYREPPSGFEQAVEPEVVDDVPWWNRGPKAGLASFGKEVREDIWESRGIRSPDGVGCWIVGRMCLAIEGKSKEEAWNVMDAIAKKMRQQNRIRFRYRRVSLAHIKPEPVQMIIDPVLPRGEVTIIDGDPDAGKSWLWMALLAGLTGSQICPLPPPLNQYARSISCALILTTEDDVAKTIQPRLEKLGADLDRIEIVSLTGEEEMFFTATDAGDILGIAKQKVPDIVIIDPLTLYAATEQGFDPNKATQVRKMLTPLVRVARKLNAVILVNRHYGKTPKSAMHRGIGSIDYAATARSMLGVNKDPEDPECTRIVSHIKSNLAPKMRESLTFLLDKNLNPPFQWSGTCDVDPDLLTDSEASSAARDEKSKRTEAMDFLQQILAEGPVPITVCREQAKELGISDSTLRRAREKLGVASEQTGFGPDKEWVWYLP